MARNLQNPLFPELPAGAEPAAAGSTTLARAIAGLEPRLHAVALRITRDPDAARDVVQNAFEKMCRHWHGFRGDSRVSTWAHRIVANESLMWLRAERRRRPAVSLDRIGEPEAEAPSAPERLARHETVEQLRQGLDALEPEERDVLRRCALEGWSYERYGRARGVGAAAAKSRAFRARKRLAARLGAA